MKMHACLLLTMLFLPALVFLPQLSSAQKDNAKTAAIKELVNSRHYTFKAQTAIPLSGKVRQLTNEYDLRVSTDRIVAYLPYFGRSYMAPIDPSRGGIQFTSKDFDYTATARKKDGWNISIKTNDVTDAQRMQLTISSNGTASLQVNSNNRQSITFNGYITEPDKKQ
ncbi:MAG: DUF4251 domain-containing protein [Bacteroidota bacterium]